MPGNLKVRIETFVNNISGGKNRLIFGSNVVLSMEVNNRNIEQNLSIF